jgi:hypothetical protein
VTVQVRGKCLDKSGQYTKQNPYLQKNIFGFIKHNIIKAVAYYNLDVTIILHMQFAQ